MLIWIVEVRILLYTTTLVSFYINGSSSTLLVEKGICNSITIQWYWYILVCVPEAQGNCDVLRKYFQAQTSQTQVTHECRTLAWCIDHWCIDCGEQIFAASHYSHTHTPTLHTHSRQAANTMAQWKNKKLNNGNSAKSNRMQLLYITRSVVLLITVHFSLHSKFTSYLLSPELNTYYSRN